MAVEITGTPVVFKSSTQNASVEVTVPADAEACIVIASGEREQTVLNLSWDNGATLDFTQIAIRNPWEWVAAYSMLSGDANWPGSGSKTLYRSAASSISTGQVWVIFFVKNINSAALVVDEEGYNSTLQPDTFDIALTGVGANDLAIIASYNWDYTSSDAAPDGYGQTAILDGADANYNSNALSVGYEVGEDSLRMKANYPRAIAFAIRAAAFSPLPVFRKQIHNLVRF